MFSFFILQHFQIFPLVLHLRFISQPWFYHQTSSVTCSIVLHVNRM